VRAQVVGDDGPPRVSGHTTYRSVIPTEQMPEDLRWNAATLWAGPKCHIVHYPLSGWKVFNLVVTYHNDAPEPVAGQPVDEDEVRKGFPHVQRAQDIIRHGTRTGMPGCCATAIRSSAGSTAAWRCWAMPRIRCCNISRRAPAWRWKMRCAWPIRCRRHDHVYHPDGPHAALRNAMMSAKSQDQWLDTLDWLYGGNGLD
jgi:hypothetical protein